MKRLGWYPSGREQSRGGGGGKATRQTEEQMRRQRWGLTRPFGEVQLAWWHLEQGAVRKEEMDGNWL